LDNWEADQPEIASWQRMHGGRQGAAALPRGTPHPHLQAPPRALCTCLRPLDVQQGPHKLDLTRVPVIAAAGAAAARCLP
jgi:hypothetical protein